MSRPLDDSQFRSIADTMATAAHEKSADLMNQLQKSMDEYTLLTLVQRMLKLSEKKPGLLGVTVVTWPEEMDSLGRFDVDLQNEVISDKLAIELGEDIGGNDGAVSISGMDALKPLASELLAGALDDQEPVLSMVKARAWLREQIREKDAQATE